MAQGPAVRRGLVLALLLALLALGCQSLQPYAACHPTLQTAVERGVFAGVARAGSRFRVETAKARCLYDPATGRLVEFDAEVHKREMSSGFAGLFGALRGLLPF